MTASADVLGQLNALSYGGLWVVSFLSNAIIPVPEEITLLGFGYLAGTGKVDILFLIPIAISGLLTSDIIVYTLSKKGSRLVLSIYERFFAKKIENHSESWFDINLNKIVFFSRFLVQLRFIGPFLAGQKNMPLKKFISFDLLALVLYVPLYIMLGKYFHSRVQSIINDVNVLRNIMLLMGGVIVTVLIFNIVKKSLLTEKIK